MSDQEWNPGIMSKQGVTSLASSVSDLSQLTKLFPSFSIICEPTVTVPTSQNYVVVVPSVTKVVPLRPDFFDSSYSHSGNESLQNDSKEKSAYVALEATTKEIYDAYIAKVQSDRKRTITERVITPPPPSSPAAAQYASSPSSKQLRQQYMPLTLDADYSNSPTVKRSRADEVLRDTSKLKRRRTLDADSKSWQSSLKKCATIIPELLREYESKSDASEVFEDSLLSKTVLSKLCRAMTRVIDASKLAKLVDTLDENSIEVLVQILAARIRDAEHIDVGIKTIAKQSSEKSSESEDNSDIMDAATKKLHRAAAGLEAGCLYLSILCGGKVESEGIIPNSLYSEDLIRAVVNMAKNQIADTLYAVIELVSRKALPLTASFETKMAGICTCCAEVLGRFANLLVNLKLDDIVIGSAIAAAHSTFMLDGVDDVDENVTSFVASLNLDSLQMMALKLLKAIYADFPSHRRDILENVTTSFTQQTSNPKAPRRYRLSNGKKIHVISALVLQLVQSYASSAKAIASLQEVVGIKSSNALQHVTNDAEIEMDLDVPVSPLKALLQSPQKATGFSSKSRKSGSLIPDADLVESSVCVKVAKVARKLFIIPANTAARTILHFFVTKCSSSALETDKDKIEKTKRTKEALTTEKEYSAVFDVFLQDVWTTLETAEWPGATIQILDKKQSSAADQSHALDKLAHLACRLGSLISKQTESQTDTQLLDHQKQIIAYLHDQQNDDYSVAAQSWMVTWMSSLPYIVKNGTCDVATADDLCLSYCHLLTSPSMESKESYDKISASDVALLLQDALVSMPPYSSYEIYVKRILSCLDSDLAGVKAKALRALGLVAASDRRILTNPNVTNAMQAKLTDPSPAVRDAALEFLGKQICSSSDITVLRHYYPIVQARMLDVALVVRKRMLKLARDMFNQLLQLEVRTDLDQEILVGIGMHLLTRLDDSEESVQEASVKTLLEMWLNPLHNTKTYSAVSLPIRKEISDRIMLIRQTVVLTRHTESAFSELLKQLFNKKKSTSKSVQQLDGALKMLNECLFEKLMTEMVNADYDSSRKSLVLLSSVSQYSSAGLITQAGALSSYLSGESAKADQRIPTLILSVLANVSPYLVDPDAKSMTLLEVELTSLLSKSNSQAIVEGAARCLSILVQRITSNYDRLVFPLARTIEMMQDVLGKLSKQLPARADPLSITQIRRAAMGYDTVTKAVYVPLLKLAVSGIPELDRAGFVALSRLFIVKPRLMQAEQSRNLIDVTFASKDPGIKIQLLRFLLEFLQIEAERFQAPTENINNKGGEVSQGGMVSALIGNHDEMTDYGVSSWLMQTYAENVITCLLDGGETLLVPAFEVIAITVKQGLVHPLFCVPALAAMQSCKESDIRDRAHVLHKELAVKHSSMMGAKNLDCVKTVFDYQTKAGPSDSVPLAMFYTVIQSLKKSVRNDFLKALVAVFDSKTDVEVSIPFFRFVAENLASLPFKTMEEVVFVVTYANRLLGITAESDLKWIESHVSGEEQSELQVQRQDRLTEVATSSLSMGMLLLAKIHLETAYRVTHATSVKDGPRNSEHPLTTLAMTPFNWNRLKYACQPMTNAAEMQEHCLQFQSLMTEDHMPSDEVSQEVGMDVDLPAEPLDVPDEPQPPPGKKRKRVSLEPKQTRRPPVSKSRKSMPASPVASKPKKKRKSKAAESDFESDEEDENYTQ
ncbi:hypothetical protein SmJEL517_g05582 [Synchytrium microbalum]|uniref:Sister chromatid cohesion protein n=1 Tax=Synchytrium microbalum TaxID=1806994 RepID=A0A507BUR2_9FUNG|nr:uncharacterized protein SmJEL517_g05582 [Synchytrium microbalum]TPX31018.1 hypothetical protein SmJEL517_g05582 [Synchytrium microbalum]